jgi:hypothetical protein
MPKELIKEIKDYLGVAIKNVANGNNVIILRKNNPNLIIKLRHGKKEKRK